ncbi:MAG: hypothetical protein KTR31_09440 [Myxococcales bacterium]|nr:hypothetical protein [Myxococcales bacterium]
MEPSDTGQGPPVSVTHMGANLLGLLCLFLGVAWMLSFPDVSRDVVGPVLMVLCAAPIVLVDVFVRKVHRRASTGLQWDRPRALQPARVAVKLLGASGAVGMVLTVYWLAPEYAFGQDFYASYYQFLWTYAPWAAGLGLAYIAVLDRYLVDPRDAYWELGQLLLGRAFDPEKVKDLLRGWVIKGFFVPLMYIYMVNNIDELRRIVTSEWEPFWIYWHFLHSLGFLVDVSFTTMGYLLSVRVLDTHIRSSEPTMLGWVAAIVCYQPFFRLISDQYIRYDNGFHWGDWLDDSPVVRLVWGAIMLVLVSVYSLSTVAFGCRFSNLTHRGVLTNGPYRYTKHPAYVSKVIYWWFKFVPFVYRGNAYQTFRDCFWMLLWGGNYWLRGRTEEWHLSKDPDYVAYGLWMNDNGLFRAFGRWFPFLAYRAPDEPSDTTESPPPT